MNRLPKLLSTLILTTLLAACTVQLENPAAEIGLAPTVDVDATATAAAILTALARPPLAMDTPISTATPTTTSVPTSTPTPTETAISTATGTATPNVLAEPTIPEVDQFCITEVKLEELLAADNPIQALSAAADIQASLFIAALKQTNPGISESRSVELMDTLGPRIRCDSVQGLDNVVGCGPRPLSGDSVIIWDGGPERVQISGTAERSDIKVIDLVNIEWIRPLSKDVVLNSISSHSGVCIAEQ